MFGNVHSPCVSSNESDKMSYETLVKSLGTAFWGCFALHAHFSLAQNPQPEAFLKLLRSRYRSYMSLVEATVTHCVVQGIVLTLPDISAAHHNLRVGDSFGDTSAAFARLLEIHKTVGSILRSTADNSLSAPLRTLCTDLLKDVQRWCYEEARVANSTMRHTSTAWIYNLPVNIHDQIDEESASSSSVTQQVNRAFANAEM